MSYSFPYALGICLATLALLGALTWLYILAVQAAADWLIMRDRRNAARNAARRNRNAAR